MSIHDFEIHRTAMISWLARETGTRASTLVTLDTLKLAQQINMSYPDGWAAFVHDQDKRYQEVSNAS